MKNTNSSTKNAQVFAVTALLLVACSSHTSEVGTSQQSSAWNNTYIVQLAEHVKLKDIDGTNRNAGQSSDSARQQLAQAYTRLQTQSRIRARYQHALQGFAVASPTQEELRALQASPLIKRVQPDFKVQADIQHQQQNAESTARTSETLPRSASDGVQTCRDTYRGATGRPLDILDERGTSVDGFFDERCQQNTTSGALLDGRGVRVFMMDMGLDRFDDDGTERMGFLDRTRQTSRIVEPGYSAVESADPYVTPRLDGTRLAGAAVGAFSRILHSTYSWTMMVHGVAPGADIVSVRIYDDQGVGTGSGVLSAIDFITKTALEAPQPSVVHANLIVPGIVEVLEDALRLSTLLGNLLYVFPIGETTLIGGDACNSSTMRLFDTLTMGYADFSAGTVDITTSGVTGACVDVFALADYVSTITDSTSTWYGSGFASAFAAGTAAMLLQNHPDYTPAEVRHRLICDATVGVLNGLDNDLPNTPDRRLYTNDIGNPAPEAIPDGSGPSITLETPHDLLPVSGTTFRVGVLDCSAIASLELRVQGSQVAMLSHPESAMHEIPWIPAAGFQPNADGTVDIELEATDALGNVTLLQKSLRASTHQTFLPIVVRP